MLLTPTEMERLTIFTAAELARKRRAKGLLLNHPEAVALISDEILEGAREGRSVAELIGFGSTILTSDDVQPGVPQMLAIIQVEGMFPDGTKLVTVHEPIRPGKTKLKASEQVRPGEVVTPEEDIELNAGRRTIALKVTNAGDRPVQVGSHFHFFEVNRALAFDRAKTFGMRLDVPAGTAVRFEPGQSKRVTLVDLGGTAEVVGLNRLTDGSTRSEQRKQQAVRRARDLGFEGV